MNFLNERERQALTELTLQMDMSEAAVMRQALRLYQLFHTYISSGHELAFRQPDGEYVRPLSAGPKLAPWSPEDESVA